MSDILSGIPEGLHSLPSYQQETYQKVAQSEGFDVIAEILQKAHKTSQNTEKKLDDLIYEIKKEEKILQQSVDLSQEERKHMLRRLVSIERSAHDQLRLQKDYFEFQKKLEEKNEKKEREYERKLTRKEQEVRDRNQGDIILSKLMDKDPTLRWISKRIFGLSSSKVEERVTRQTQEETEELKVKYGLASPYEKMTTPKAVESFLGQNVYKEYIDLINKVSGKQGTIPSKALGLSQKYSFEEEKRGINKAIPKANPTKGDVLSSGEPNPTSFLYIGNKLDDIIKVSENNNEKQRKSTMDLGGLITAPLIGIGAGIIGIAGALMSTSSSLNAPKAPSLYYGEKGKFVQKQLGYSSLSSSSIEMKPVQMSDKMGNVYNVPVDVARELHSTEDVYNWAEKQKSKAKLEQRKYGFDPTKASPERFQEYDLFNKIMDEAQQTQQGSSLTPSFGGKYHNGGQIYKDQVATLRQDEIVLSPGESNMYREGLSKMIMDMPKLTRQFNSEKLEQLLTRIAEVLDNGVSQPLAKISKTGELSVNALKELSSSASMGGWDKIKLPGFSYGGKAGGVGSNEAFVTE